MQKKFTAILVCLLLALSLVACASQPAPTPSSTPEPAPSSQAEEPASVEATITHGLGETVLNTNPLRVVVFDYGALDALDFAGIEIVGLGKTASLPEHLSKYADDKYKAAGSLHEPDFEAVNELEPDLIIIGARASKAYEELSKIAPTVLFTMPTSNYVDVFEGNLKMLSEIFTDKAELLTAQIDNVKTGAAAVAQKAEAAGYTALVLMVNDSEISVFGAGTRFAVVYDNFGFKPADDNIEQSTHGQSAAFEYLAQVDPDYLFVIDRSAATGAATDNTGAMSLMDNQLMSGTKAAKNDNIVYLNSTNWYVVSGGINSTLAMIDEVAASVK